MSKLPDKRIGNDFVALQTWFVKNKRLLAWIAYGVLAASVLLSRYWPTAFPVAVVMYLSVITSILVDLYRRSRPSKAIYPSHQETASEFHDEIRSALESAGECELTWIGVTMQSAWLTLENTFGKALQARSVSDVHVRLLQSDPAYLASILEESDSQPGVTKRQADLIQAFCQRQERNLRATGCSVSLAQYAYMPNIHGLLINDKVLFLSNVRWSGDNLEDLSVPHEPFERFDMTTRRGAYMIEFYRSWLRKGFACATRLEMFPSQEVADSSDEVLDDITAGMSS